MDKFWLGLAAFYGFSGVAMGAFAAHALKTRLDAYALGIMQTATQYQLLHAVLMVAILLGTEQWQHGPGRHAVICLAIGIPLFSGSLYALALTGIKGLGAITPLGGVLFLAAWTLLLVQGLRT